MNTDRIINLGKHGKNYWYLDLVVCTNAEVLFGSAEDPSGNGYRDEAREAREAVQTVIWEACRDFARQSNDFAAWNGGRYDGQRNAYGYVCWGGLAYRVLSAEPNDEDGDEDGDATVVGLAGAPPEIRDEVNRICTAASKAIAAVVKRTLAEPTPYPAGYTVTSKRGMNPWATVETLAEARIEAEAARARGFDGEIWLGGEWLAEDE